MHAPRVLVAAAAVLTLLGSGCGAGEPDAADDPGASQASASDQEPAPTRCGEGSGGEELVLEPEPGVRLPAAVYGAGDTVLVLLHQTNLDGRCGWDAFAQAAAEHGVGAIAFDMCGWAESECPEEWSERSSDQAAYAVDYARDELGADRVVLVGASMGGARTIFALADGVEVDDWISLSPAPAWDGRETTARRRRSRCRGWWCTTRTTATRSTPPPGAAAQAAGAEFVEGRGGHGYDMVTRIQGGLTPLGERVVERALSGPAAG